TEKLAKSYGEKQVLSDVNFEIERGQKVAFIGKNGMGKTTMARIIVGEIEKSGGNLDLGYNIEIGFFAQHHAEALPRNLTVFDSVDQLAEGDIRLQVRNILGAFMFSGEDVDKKISVLSGGERARVCLAQLLLQPSNTLILDEPTNHLDIRSKDVLKESIKRYPGTVIIVSHDRDFLIGLTDKVFEFTDGTVKEYFGDIENFFEEKKIADFRAFETEEIDIKKTDTIVTTNKPIDKQEKQIKNSINKIEQAIEQAETNIQSLEAKIASNYDEATVNELMQAKEKLASLMKEWEDLVG
ncbi:MAG: ATP-binding cassette domain-containing protein, partial [Chitinophagales bacterium]